MQLAVLIVLLHNAIPHHHHSEPTNAAICTVENPHSDEGLLDILGDIFHTDLGGDHLENWVQSGQPILVDPDIDKSAEPWFIGDIKRSAFSRASSAPVLRDTAPITLEAFVFKQPQRGPPSYISA